MSRSFDVLVAGAGPAGSAAALDLARRGFRVALIEQAAYETPRIGETLPPIIRHHLTALGVWQKFLECRPVESYGIQTAWETAEPRCQEFLRNPYGCGWHVDRARFDSMLASAAVAAGAEFVAPAKIVSCRRTPDDAWQLDALHNGTPSTLTGRTLLDATGRRALLATQLGSQPHVTDRLIGAVAFSDTSLTAHETLIEAAEHGWWYSAPLPNGRAVFTYMTDSDLWRNSEWSALLAQAPLTAARAGATPIPPPAHIVSAASVIRHPVTGPGWIAIGDAALAFDPLSGQGVLKSLETAARAAEALARHAEPEYETWVHESYAAYLTQRHTFYAAVTRWPASTFWLRR